MTIQNNDFASIYYHILDNMLDYAILYGKTKMIEDLHFTLTDPQRSLVPLKKNWAWAFHEGINRLSFEFSELQNPGTAYKYRPNWNKKLIKEGGRFCYSYGECYSLQVPTILKKLRSKSEREAIVSVWTPEFLSRKFERRPCTLFLHFYYVRSKLNCHCSMRTSDVMNLLPYDVFHHTLLQRYLATVLDVELGNFHFTSSFAYYQKKRDVTGSVKNTLTKLREAKPLTYLDDWRFSENDRRGLIGMTRVINEELTSSILEYQRGVFSNFGHNYANALLYYDKLTRVNIDVSGSEFHVIYL